MISFFIFFPLIITAIVAQDCSSPTGTRDTFGQYLLCMKQGIDKNYELYENEIREHGRKAALTCFSPTIEEGNRNDRCVLNQNDLNQVAWDRRGPLRDCTICRTFASGALKALKSTPPEDQKCIRAEITKAIAREANYCLKQKIPDFVGVPDIPDIEEGSFIYKDSVISFISDHILIHSRLNFCGERKPTRAANTIKCLHNPFVGYLKEHCKVLNSCDSRIAVGSCAKTIPQSRTATCHCINDARNELKKRIASISNVFADLIAGRGGIAIGSSSKVDVCVSNIKKQMVTPVNDWVTVVDTALSACIKKKPAGQNLGMEAMLNVGCRKVFADTTGTASSQLRIGFDFVNNLIDAMVERSGRFCGSHCFQS
ncbi:hypothetical protein DICVIV_03526 [Dictyocaulus viviparus]|uniref:Surfactant protein B n=1 Tax=Dictyocaulus viviparus TaxID=29172 RepID=A0A0D8Y2E2_DICVI|nr:hypothetical protein DICVIV_03526 [Dictyocaulus viviparus]